MVSIYVLLPARASEQGNVIGLVSVYTSFDTSSPLLTRVELDLYVYSCHQKKIVIE